MQQRREDLLFCLLLNANVPQIRIKHFFLSIIHGMLSSEPPEFFFWCFFSDTWVRTYLRSQANFLGNQYLLWDFKETTKSATYLNEIQTVWNKIVVKGKRGREVKEKCKRISGMKRFWIFISRFFTFSKPAISFVLQIYFTDLFPGACWCHNKFISDKKGSLRCRDYR